MIYMDHNHNNYCYVVLHINHTIMQCYIIICGGVSKNNFFFKSICYSAEFVTESCSSKKTRHKYKRRTMETGSPRGLKFRKNSKNAI